MFASAGDLLNSIQEGQPQKPFEELHARTSYEKVQSMALALTEQACHGVLRGAVMCSAVLYLP